MSEYTAVARDNQTVAIYRFDGGCQNFVNSVYVTPGEIVQVHNGETQFTVVCREDGMNYAYTYSLPLGNFISKVLL